MKKLTLNQLKISSFIIQYEEHQLRTIKSGFSDGPPITSHESAPTNCPTANFCEVDEK